VSGDFPYIEGTIASATDFDNDGDLDVVCANSSSVFVLENEIQEPFGYATFSLHGSETPVPYGGPPTDLSLQDYNLDGYQDVLVGFGDPSSSTGTTDLYLFANQEGVGSERTLVDVTAVSGLSGNDKLAGFSVSDYNRDGLSDLYLTRPSSSTFFYKAKPTGSQDQNNWVGIRLKSSFGKNNTDGLGATVIVTAGAMIQTQVVDGGSGLASQHEPDLVFGLGDYVGTVSVQVKWPSGHVQNLSGVSTNQYKTISDDSPVIDNDSIEFSKVFHVNTGLETWEFTWETYNNSTPALDKVIFDLSGVPVQCQPDYGVLKAQWSRVTVVIVPIGGAKYRHTLTYEDVECKPRCQIPFYVKSAVVDCSSTSVEQLITTGSCLIIGK